jgi:hypothetical protein
MPHPRMTLGIVGEGARHRAIPCLRRISHRMEGGVLVACRDVPNGERIFVQLIRE